MNISESEKNRIRGLHKEYSIIKEYAGKKGDDSKSHKDFEGDTEFNMDEKWGEGRHEYRRTDVDGVETKTGDAFGHYKDYELPEGHDEGHVGEQDLGYGFDEAGDVIGVDRPESAAAQDEFNVEESDININEDTEGEETYNYGEDEGEDHDEEMDLEHDEDMAPHDRIDAIEKHLDALRKDMSYDEDREDRGEAGDDFE